MSLPLNWRALLLALTLLVPTFAAAQAADTIRENLSQRIPGLTEIAEINETPMSGLYEVIVGTEVLYTDAQGDFLIQGALVDTRERRNLTEERVEKLTAISFDELQLDHAFTTVRGKGERQLAVFEDPNCTYCKRFEKNLQEVDNVTVHVFLLPILGPDSVKKSQQIWCSDDRAAMWDGWMLSGVQPKGKGNCDTEALDANLKFARTHRITGTPTLIFVDGRRVPGAIDARQIEQMLVP